MNLLHINNRHPWFSTVAETTYSVVVGFPSCSPLGIVCKREKLCPLYTSSAIHCLDAVTLLLVPWLCTALRVFRKFSVGKFVHRKLVPENVVFRKLRTRKYRPRKISVWKIQCNEEWVFGKYRPMKIGCIEIALTRILKLTIIFGADHIFDLGYLCAVLLW